MLDGQVLEASQVEYKPFGKPPLKREPPACRACAKVGILPPRSEFRLRFFARKTHHRASAEGLGAMLSSQHRSQSVFLPLTHPAANPGVNPVGGESVSAVQQDAVGVFRAIRAASPGVRLCVTTLSRSFPSVSALLCSRALTDSPPGLLCRRKQLDLPHSFALLAKFEAGKPGESENAIFTASQPEFSVSATQQRASRFQGIAANKPLTPGAMHGHLPRPIKIRQNCGSDHLRSIAASLREFTSSARV